MTRLACISMVALAGCDIVGNVPDDIEPKLERVDANCEGQQPTFKLFANFDATIAEGEQVSLTWDVTSSSAVSTNFVPSVDCGWWTLAYVYGSDLSQLRITGATCDRIDGPPRQIVTVRGTANVRGGNSSATLFADFDAAVISADGFSTSAQDSQSPPCFDQL